MKIQGILTILLLCAGLPLCAQLLQNDCGESIIDYQNKTFKIDCLPALIEAPGAVNKAEWGEFLWEFGDGHYSVEERPVHGYAQSGAYRVKAYLLPYYANNLAYRTKEYTINGSGPATSERYTVLQNKKQVGIYTNARNRLVPGSEIRVVVHYRIPDKLPPGTPGYLLFFYNQEGESGLRYSPFQPAYDVSNYYNESPLGAPTTILTSPIPEATVEYLKQQLGRYDVRAFRVPGLKVGESRERRLFLSLQSYAKLRSYVPKDIDQIENDRIQLSLKAVFVPESPAYAFDPDFASDQYNLTLAKVHDPNKIKVEPRIGFYKKGDPERLLYTVQFQNKGSGAVNRIDIKLPWADAQNLDISKLQIQDWSPRTENMQICPTRFDPLVDRYPCLQIDSTSFQKASMSDTLILTLHNVSVGSKQEDGVRKRDTKGEIKFSIPSNNEKLNRTDLRAIIVFEGANPLPTRKAKTRWWQKTMGIKLGYNFSPSLDGYTGANDDISDALGGGIYYQRNALRQGVGYGLSLDYNRFRYEKNIRTLTDNAELVYRENLRFDLLELRGTVSYQWKGALRVFGSLGVGTPLSGHNEAAAERYVFDGSQAFLSVADTTSARFGLLNADETDLLFNEEVANQQFVGFMGAAGVEFGALSDFAVGAEVTRRHFPSFVNGGCAGQFNIHAYIRIKLATRK